METKTVNWVALRQFCQRLMMQEGMQEQDAFICADNLVDADLAGVESHGVSRMTNYMKRLRTRVVDPCGKPEIIKAYPGSLYIDGKNAMGMVASHYAMQECIKRAKENGGYFCSSPSF